MLRVFITILLVNLFVPCGRPVDTGDVTPPLLTSLNFFPAGIDTTSASATVTVAFAGTDDLSGIRQIMIGFRSPSGQEAYNGAAAFSGTTVFTGLTTVAFPRFSEAGAWTLFDIRTFDQVSNVRFYTSTEIAALIPRNTVIVQSISDTAAPILSALSFSPVLVDTSWAPASVSIAFAGADELSGVKKVMIGFRSPSGQQEAYNGAAALAGTTIFTGTTAVTFPRFSEAGTWALFDLRTFDQAGNVKFYAPAEIAALVSQNTIQVQSIDDVTAPKLTALSFSPAAIDTSLAPANVTITFEGVDDFSGIKQVMIGFRSPSGLYSKYNAGTVFWGAVSFTGATDIAFPKYSETGVWTLFDIRTFDNAGNVRFYTPAEIASLVPQSTITVHSAIDVTAPQLTSLSFSHTEIDTSSSSANVAVAFAGIDDLSGVKQIVLGFRSPSGQQSVHSGATAISGSTSFTGTATVTFPKSSDAGVWTLNEVETSDQAGNVKSYTSAEMAALVPLNALTVTAGGSTQIEPLRLVPVTPCRVADTRLRTGPTAGLALEGGTTHDFVIQQSACGIPANARAFVLNVTAVPAGQLGYLTIWPAGRDRPSASTLNSHDGRVRANAALIGAGVGGSVSVFPSNPTHLVLDISGYFVPVSDTAGLAFYPVAPCRVIDTRRAEGQFGGPSIGGGQSRRIAVTSSPCGIPSGARAFSLNLTVVPRGPLGYVTTWPTGATMPNASTLNAGTGQVTANAAIVPAGAGGSIDVFASNPTDLVVDVNGYFAPPYAAGALSFYALTPCRAVDTRNATGPHGGPALLGSRNFDLPASACAVPAASAFVLNATVVPKWELGYLTLWPAGGLTPNVSTLNSSDGTVVANAAIVPASNGWLSVFASNPTEVIIDINGYFGQ
jgi:hypothetical protein